MQQAVRGRLHHPHQEGHLRPQLRQPPGHGEDRLVHKLKISTLTKVRTEHCNEAPCPGSVATTAAVPVAVCLMVGLGLAVVCCCLYR